MRKHGTYDAQTWYLRCTNMVFAMRKHGICDALTWHLRSAKTINFANVHLHAHKQFCDLFRSVEENSVFEFRVG